MSTSGGTGGGGGGSFPNFTGAGSPEGVQVSTLGQWYQDTANGALYVMTNAGPINTGWLGLGNIDAANAVQEGFFGSQWLVESGATGSNFHTINDDGSVQFPGGTNVYFHLAHPPVGIPANQPAVGVDRVTAKWYFGDGLGWHALGVPNYFSVAPAVDFLVPFGFTPVTWAALASEGGPFVSLTGGGTTITFLEDGLYVVALQLVYNWTNVALAPVQYVASQWTLTVADVNALWNKVDFGPSVVVNQDAAASNGYGAVVSTPAAFFAAGDVIRLDLTLENPATPGVAVTLKAAPSSLTVVQVG